MNGSLIRKISLWGLILGDIAMLTFWWLSENYTFFWTFVAITLCVIAGEIINATLVYGKTLSTQVKHSIREGGKKRAYVYLALGFLGFSIASLIVHLGVAW